MPDVIRKLGGCWYPELLARVAAVLRRRAGARRGPIRLGDLSVDPVTRRVAVGERQVQLANKEFALLRALAAEPHRVFTKDELLRDLWGFRSKGRTRTLDSHASRLRRKLDPKGARYVFNCWGGIGDARTRTTPELRGITRVRDRMRIESAIGTRIAGYQERS
jgi:DNA-binding response OmpR family regulator